VRPPSRIVASAFRPSISMPFPCCYGVVQRDTNGGPFIRVFRGDTGARSATQKGAEGYTESILHTVNARRVKRGVIAYQQNILMLA